MRKYIIGMLFGIALTIGVSANAEVNSMINKVVQGEYNFTIGNDLLESKAIIVDGLAYVPARLAGETSGHIVRFDEVAGVKWIKKISTPKATVLKTIEVHYESIARNQNAISRNEAEISKLRDGIQSDSVLMDIQAMEKSIEKQRQGITQLQEQIAKLNQTLADIDAQEAELAQ